MQKNKFSFFSSKACFNFFIKYILPQLLQDPPTSPTPHPFSLSLKHRQTNKKKSQHNFKEKGKYKKHTHKIHKNTKSEITFK